MKLVSNNQKGGGYLFKKVLIANRGGIGIRIDSACYEGDYISPFYDSMISKVVSWGRDRDEAIKRMQRALNEFIISGVKTTIPFHKELMKNDIFRSGIFNTKFLELNNILSSEK
ncbi:MAG: hypothetical protein E7214_06170 [Clostridium sp.]|nr:hypothetical protein [Clostridium sp.]